MKGQKRISTRTLHNHDQNQKRSQTRAPHQSRRRIWRIWIWVHTLCRCLHHPNPALPPCHFACAWGGAQRGQLSRSAAGVCKSYLVIQRYMQCYLALLGVLFSVTQCHLALCSVITDIELLLLRILPWLLALTINGEVLLLLTCLLVLTIDGWGCV